MTDESIAHLGEHLAPFLGSNRITIGKHGVFLYSAYDTVIGRALDVYGEFAEDENDLLVKFLKPGQLCVDVDANIGTMTVPLARRVGPTGTVVAVEPQRHAFTLLCANVALNGLTQVKPVFAALGAKSEMARIVGPKHERHFNLGSVSLNSPDATEDVSVVTLDALGLPACAIIKIDVEGMEPQVLSGGAETIERYRPVIYFEAKTGAGTKACIEFLRQRDYSLYWHFAPFFRPRNFRGVANDIFRTPTTPAGARTGDINALAVPGELNLQLRLPPVSGPDGDWRKEVQNWRHNQRS